MAVCNGNTLTIEKMPQAGLDSRAARSAGHRLTELTGLLSLWTFGWLVVLGLTALCDNISVYIGPSPKEREEEEKG